MRKLAKILLLILLLSAISYPLNATYAAVPHLINYQGRLTDSEGTPLNGTYELTFRIYDAESAGNLLWEETHSGVVIETGIFSILLGSVANLNLPFDNPYFLEIKVDSEVMSPRQAITSSGYAIRAEVADEAKTKTSAGDTAPGYLDAKIKNSIVADNNQLQLSGDQASPGNNKVYSTDKNGNRGWRTMSFTPSNIQVFTSSGTWIKPPDVNTVYVKIWGGGGGGGAGVAAYDIIGGGGGAGGYCEGIVDVSGNIVVTVGNGGGPMGAGGASSFAGNVTLMAGGGSGAASSGIGGAGGSASGGQVNLTGDGGQKGNTGGSGGQSPFGGAGGVGCGNRGALYTGNGSFPGGGGGGGINTGGGTGAKGLVIVYY